MESQSVLQSLFKVLLPEVIATHFEIKSVKGPSDRMEIILKELPELVPPGLVGCTYINLDSFCNPVELQTFPLKGLPVYLIVCRRRWKQKGSKQHFSNEYNIHPKGVIATHDFAAFLSESIGYTPDQYNDYFSGAGRLWEKAMAMGP